MKVNTHQRQKLTGRGMRRAQFRDTVSSVQRLYGVPRNLATLVCLEQGIEWRRPVYGPPAPEVKQVNPMLAVPFGVRGDG